MLPAADTTSPKSFILPDLASHCDIKLRVNRHRKQITVETKKWLFYGDNLVGAKCVAYHGLNAGLLTAMTYPDAAYPQLRVCNDFLTFLFHLDNLSDDMDDRRTRSIGDVVLNSLYHPYTYQSNIRIGRMTRHLFKRILQTSSPGMQQRFIETVDFFFQSVTQQALDRATGVIPDLKSYIALRRDTSGCKPCWALIEHANNLTIPDEVMSHPTILALGEATNDLVTWSNDIFSYNVEQSKGDTHNMIPVVMNERGLDLQAAVDFVGEMCKSAIDRFKTERANLPSWGLEIDRQVVIYVQGLADWIVGSLNWSFESTRYFGIHGHKIKKTRVVELLPLRPEAEARVMSISSRPSRIRMSASVSSFGIQTPNESEPQTPSDIHPSTTTSKSYPDEVISHSPFPVIDSTIDTIVSPASNPHTQVPDCISQGLLPGMVVSKSATASITGVSAQSRPPECFSPVTGSFGDQHSAKNVFAQPFGLYSLTLWTFYILVYQPVLILMSIFKNHDVHPRPSCHYKYM